MDKLPGTQEFFSLISNTAGGYCFYKDARLRRITRYRYNNVPIDFKEDIFTLMTVVKSVSGWMPVRRDMDYYECRHGTGYTAITGELTGLRPHAIFAPLNINCEVHKVTLKIQVQ